MKELENEDEIYELKFKNIEKAVKYIRQYESKISFNKKKGYFKNNLRL